MSEKTEFVGTLVAAIITSDEVEPQNWEEFSLVIAFEDDRVSETYGYSYDANGDWEAIAIRPRLVREEAAAYRDWLKRENDKALIKMLVQFNRSSNGYNVDFEYDNPARWNVTPSNLSEITEKLRRHLGG
ncbi:hypothetical protein [Rhizobium halophytocola]|uniref:DUF600 family protein n=1 Tax=Rhizobium halophytocola TaxID=735519 RepID=A0ABS4E652_9HYPH|nr:hypothetical protein [Rhizobium halophytocola]MBP1853424.1 hypothetical protein [Rhizobium halophytocola]